MALTGKLARAARALVEWPRDHVARLAGVEEQALADFENGRTALPEPEALRLHSILEEGGAQFLPETDGMGVGVRLKFTARDARAINRMESEGGPVGTDDL
ncbi:DNA-binding protein [Sphingobium sp. AP49]|uniref:hypothetical protein n=1 Tax=Sphingobium sp. AP49 TaxID=1144307 RepID=UPI00026EC83F|nr:hypothetical protein [Sphingobium sp. AP49]WHO40801.1 DNA-binding protein [Sphingobium sp. AP49]